MTGAGARGADAGGRERGATVPDTDPVRAFLEDRHLSLAADAAALAAERVAPLPPAEDDGAARERAREILGLLGEGGLLDPVGAEDFRACCLVREALAAVSPLADAVFALQALAGTPLLLAGDDALRERWLGPALRGEAMGAFAMTEPGAGSDIGAVATVARRDAGEYVLDGTKTLISNAGIADFYVVYATVAPEAGGPGLTAFVVEAEAPGLRFERAQVLSEPHPLGELRLAGCRVPAAARLGAEGDGRRIGLGTLDRLRPTVGAAACGMAARALREAVAHAVRRRQFGRPLAEHQLVREKLGRMATDLTAARLLVYRAAWERDRGAARTDEESAMAKSFATEAAQRIVDEAVQVLGGRGVLADHPVDRLYRAVRPLRIYEGTTEIQRLVVAGKVIERLAPAETAADGDGAGTADGDPGEGPAT